ncbi:CHY and RING finger domain protein, putative [Talaromyces stipitatus ATCC 10500]|uniref:CHY and RING finger domain protein, putative n=1 Tax=Talaromyces stipitatus (strain ATCC 10500 / CBS 375.48 / QM 6759 / NRRL 1006) TaxID=441959 RepID=B8M787_TALSN|nr:CHY and RING finger domain protein, putative [Talaromyces stipitatus ATCC 10500]EED20307.1 CHY and RING finger domain protein, putative [Talaromyces stipitatus ATCC 10500]
MEDRLVVNAYRQLYKKGLQAVRRATPARHVLRNTLRTSFRSESRAEFDLTKIARTLEFLDRAAESTSYEHKILKNLLHVRYYEQPSSRVEKEAKIDYISSLFIEPILRHARRFSQLPELSASDDESLPPSPGHHDLDEPAQSALLQLPIPSPQKFISDVPHSVTRSALLDTDLDCAQRRLVACRASDSNDDVRLGTMDASQSQQVSSDEDTRQLPSHPATNTYTESNTGGITSTPSDATGDRSPGSKLRELPEDDGMTDLRRRIHAIRDNDASGIQKARLIHSLMIESYEAARKTFSERPTSSQSPPRPRSRERSVTSSPPRTRRSPNRDPNDYIERRPGTPLRIYYNVSPQDLEPTFAPKDIDVTVDNNEESLAEKPVPSTENDDIFSNSDYADEDVLVLGCPHYKRNVKLQCYTCRKWYTCRFCHNQLEDHPLERQKTENMLCMLCGLPQPAGQWCKGCGEQTASYFCALCKLWDNDSSKSIYHCYDCGICRIGQGIGKDFFHCKTCSVCMPISIENTHRCIERSTQCDCPICGEYMFTSPDTVVFMKCGHSIHQKCYDEFSKSSYRCPICSKSIMNMEARFRNLDRTIESQPMPSEFEDTRAMIYCNDCGAKSNVPYHWLGLKCDLCESYNTAQLRLLRGDGETTESELVLRTRAIPVNIPDHSFESMSATRLGAEHFSRDANDRRRPSTATSANGHPIPPRRRAVSPTVGNYFELSRDSTWAASIFSSRRSEGGNDDDDEEEPGFWATSPLRKYSFFRKHTGLSDDESDSDNDSGTTNDIEDEDEDDNDVEEDEEDEMDAIEIFGHR